MKNKRMNNIKPNYVGKEENISNNKEELSRNKLRNKFLQRAVKKYENLLTRLSRT